MAAKLVVAGAFLLIASAAGFVVVPEHQPGVKLVGSDRSPYCFPAGNGASSNCNEVATGLSRTIYDALRIVTWSCLIVGVLTSALGLLGYARPASRGS